MWFVTSTKTDYIIVNSATLRSKKIGRRGKGRGVNYLDRARDEATKRNNDGVRAAFIDEYEFNEARNSPQPREALEATLR